MMYKYGLLYSLVVLCLIAGCVSVGNESVTTTLPSTTTTLRELVNCMELAQEIISDIDALNFCSVDEDCALTQLPCPFGCRIYNQFNGTESIQESVAEYGSECGFCPNQCVSQGGDLLCDAGRCSPVLTKVALKVDNRDRGLGEVAEVTLVNELNRTVYVSVCDEFQLKVRSEGAWNTVRKNSCGPGDFVAVPPVSERVFALGDYNISAGRYRVESTVWVKCLQYPRSPSDCQKNTTMVSDDFRFKE